MATKISPSSTGPSEKTFTTYTLDQSRAYAKYRFDYHSSVYETVIRYHRSTGGQFDTVLDIGCGPGLASRTLAEYFAHARGIDPSEAMISQAIASKPATYTGEPVSFSVSSAEDLHTISSHSIDLITAANAAHWFDMDPFWHEAARVLKPSGSVAMWATGELHAHPKSPNARAIDAAIRKNREEYLALYLTSGNLLTLNGYKDLPMPWDLIPAVKDFEQNTILRRDWHLGEDFLSTTSEMDMNTFELATGTASPVTRWRQANPQKVGTEDDVVRILRREIERLLHEAGVEKGKEILKGYVSGTAVIVKKKGT